MAAVLVTGSSGFIGRRIAAALMRHGHSVHGLDVIMNRHADFSQYLNDLSSVDSLRARLREHRIEMVVHTGGVSGPLLAQDAPYSISQGNVFASLNLIEAVRVEKVRRLIHLSSASALGPTTGDDVPDDAPLRPVDIYGASKAAVELMYRAHFMCQGMQAITLRLPTVYGPGSARTCLIATMIERALSHSPAHIKAGRDYACPFLHVDDAVSVICSALEAREWTQPSYNIAGPDYVTVGDIAKLVRDHVPDAEISFGHGPPLPGYERGRFDCTAAQRDLKFTPAIDIATGVARSVEWLRSFR